MKKIAILPVCVFAVIGCADVLMQLSTWSDGAALTSNQLVTIAQAAKYLVDQDDESLQQIEDRYGIDGLRDATEAWFAATAELLPKLKALQQAMRGKRDLTAKPRLIPYIEQANFEE